MEQPPDDCVDLPIQRFAELYECSIVSPQAIHKLKRTFEVDNMLPAIISLRMNGLFSGNCSIEEEAAGASQMKGGESGGGGKYDNLVPIWKKTTENMALDGFILGFGLCLSHHDYMNEKKIIERIYREMREASGQTTTNARAILPEPQPSHPPVITQDNIFDYDIDPDLSTKNLYDGNGRLLGSSSKKRKTPLSIHDMNAYQNGVRSRHEFDDLIKKYSKSKDISVKYIDPREVVILRQRDLVSGAFKWFVYKPIYYHPKNMAVYEGVPTIQYIIQTIGLPHLNTLHQSPSSYLRYHRLTNIQIFLLNEPSPSTNEPVSHISRLMKENETLDTVIDSYKKAIKNNSVPIYPLEQVPKNDKDGVGKKNTNPYPYTDNDQVNYGLLETHLDEDAYLANHLNEKDQSKNELMEQGKQPLMVEAALTQAQQQMVIPDYAMGARYAFARNVRELREQGEAFVRRNPDPTAQRLQYVRLPPEHKVGHYAPAIPPPDMIELLDRKVQNIMMCLGIPAGVGENYALQKKTTSSSGTSNDNLSGGQTSSILSTSWQLYAEEQQRYLNQLQEFMNSVLQQASSMYSRIQTQKFQNKRFEVMLRYCQSEDNPEEALKERMLALGPCSEHRLSFVLEAKQNLQQLMEMYENAYIKWDCIKQKVAKELNKTAEDMEPDPIIERARREKLLAKAQAEGDPKPAPSSSSS